VPPPAPSGKPTIQNQKREGIVAKRKTGVYSEHGWLKIKNPNYSQSEGRQEMFEAFHERRKSSSKTS
jgi:hypothetical protein